MTEGAAPVQGKTPAAAHGTRPSKHKTRAITLMAAHDLTARMRHGMTFLLILCDERRILKNACFFTDCCRAHSRTALAANLTICSNGSSATCGGDRARNAGRLQGNEFYRCDCR